MTLDNSINIQKYVYLKIEFAGSKRYNQITEQNIEWNLTFDNNNTCT